MNMAGRGTCIALLAAALAACTPVFSEEPVGSEALALSPAQIEGVWVLSEEPGQLKCCYFIELAQPENEAGGETSDDAAAAAGRFRMIAIGNEKSKLSSMHLEGRFMRHNDVIFGNIAKSDGANAPGVLEDWRSGHLFGLIKFQGDDEIHLMLPKEAAFAQSIEEGRLPAGDGCGGEGPVCLGRLEASHLDFLTQPDCLEAHFATTPIVFRRFPFSVD
jgi:hypothetical protein